MKLNKKFISCFMAAAMAVAPMSAYADPVASGTITGDGEIAYTETEVYNVILPTTEALKFHVDPYGLLSVTDSDSLENVLSDSALKGGVTSKATAVVNKSSMPIDVAVEVNVVSGDAMADVVLVSSPEAVAAASVATGSGLYLAITPLSGAGLTAVTSAATDAGNLALDSSVTGSVFGLSTASVFTSGTPITDTAIKANGVNTSVSGTAINFSLDGMSKAYSVTSRSSVAVINETTAASILATAGNTNMYAFAITGKADSDSDAWADFAAGNKALQVSMKFVISSVNAPLVTNGGTVNATLNANSVSFTIDSSKTITKISNGGYDLTGATISGKRITITNGSDVNSSYLLSNAGKTPLTISFSDSSTYTVNVSVN